MLSSGLLSLIAAYNFTYTDGVHLNNTSQTHQPNNSTEYSLEPYLYTVVHNDSNAGQTLEPTQVDCLGLGTTVASTLSWFLMSKPNGTKALDVKFYLTSREQRRRARIVLGNQFGLDWTDFRISRRTVIIVHGFLSTGDESWITDMEAAFLHWGDVNVLTVDWSSGGNTWNYYKAALNTKVVGYQIAHLLEQIGNASLADGTGESPWGSLHMVGHSLGAHICGFTAKELKRRQSRFTIDRITGLDPAQPCFRNADPTVKLHKTDAPFVDVIHTNGKLLSQIGFGLPEPIGHVDFYPNGGRVQPGCLIRSTASQYPPLSPSKLNRAICSHGRSYVYLTESLVSAARNNCTFWAHKWDLTFRNLRQVILGTCDDEVCTEMGINSEKHPLRGTFFVATSNTPPFCVNSTMVNSEVWAQLKQQYADELQD